MINSQISKIFLFVFCCLFPFKQKTMFTNFQIWFWSAEIMYFVLTDYRQRDHMSGVGRASPEDDTHHSVNWRRARCTVQWGRSEWQHHSPLPQSAPRPVQAYKSQTGSSRSTWGRNLIWGGGDKATVTAYECLARFWHDSFWASPNNPVCSHRPEHTSSQ